MDSDKYTLRDFLSIGGDDVFAKADAFAEYTADMRAKRFETYRMPMSGRPSGQVSVEAEDAGPDHKMAMFGSNNYLGMTTHPRVIAACHRALDRFGAASGGPPLLGGMFSIHNELEARLAEFKGAEDVILFPSGYAANMGAVSALVGPIQVAVLDQYCHASILDGAGLSQGKAIFFRHNDPEHLEAVLKRCQSEFEGALVVVDGVYSTSGHLADLPELLPVIRRYKARLLVDDAHATGVVGPGGRGTASVFGLEDEVDLVMGTLSKSLGGLGGFVSGPAKAIDYLRYYGKSQFFSTSIPPVIAAGVIEALCVIEEEPQILQRLWLNTQYLKNLLTERGFDLGQTQAPILPIVIGDEPTLRKVGRDLCTHGIYASAIPFPAVPRNQARIRFSVSATHSLEDLRKAAEVMEQLGRRYKLIPEREGPAPDKMSVPGALEEGVGLA